MLPSLLTISGSVITSSSTYSATHFFLPDLTISSSSYRDLEPEGSCLPEEDFHGVEVSPVAFPFGIPHTDVAHFPEAAFSKVHTAFAAFLDDKGLAMMVVNKHEWDEGPTVSSKASLHYCCYLYWILCVLCHSISHQHCFLCWIESSCSVLLAASVTSIMELHSFCIMSYSINCYSLPGTYNYQACYVVVYIVLCQIHLQAQELQLCLRCNWPQL